MNSNIRIILTAYTNNLRECFKELGGDVEYNEMSDVDFVDIFLKYNPITEMIPLSKANEYCELSKEMIISSILQTYPMTYGDDGELQLKDDNFYIDGNKLVKTLLANQSELIKVKEGK